MKSKTKLNKLVRDKIPQIIEKEGKVVIIKVANEKEYQLKLKEKLIEEVKEFLKAETKEEFADIIEVLNAIGKLKGFDREEIEELRKNKATKKGTFSKRIILEKIIP